LTGNESWNEIGKQILLTGTAAGRRFEFTEDTTIPAKENKLKYSALKKSMLNG
jgi:hypothetical protein